MSKLKVTVHRDGFRRLGRVWTGTTEIDTEEFSEDELKLLAADPMFTIEPAGSDDDDPLDDALVDAIAELDKTDFDKNGRPKVAALGKAVGVKIDAAQRDRAWERYQLLQGGDE